MLDPKDILYRWNINEIATFCQVDMTTARRWKRGAICPPYTALCLLSRDLGIFDPAWCGWLLKDGSLWSPEGWEIRRGDVLASRLHEAQLAAWRHEVQKMKILLANAEAARLEEQPRPEDWDIQILVG